MSQHPGSLRGPGYGERPSSKRSRRSPLLSLARHEMCHAIAALLGGADEARITDDGDSWRTDYKDMPNDEFAVACSWVAALIVPEHLSADDRIVIGTMPAELRNRAKRWCDEKVKPVIDAMTDEELARIVAKVQDGGIVFRRTRHN